ncbi:MAG: helix-turn-helix transcriptional regulator [Treponema sp.]
MDELFKDKYRTAYKRMFEIDKMIRAGKCPSAKKIAEKLEVSKRTIQRDLRYMEMNLGAPIEYSHEKRGYFYCYPDFALLDFAYSESDIAVLTLAWRLMDSLFGGTFYAPQIDDIFRSIVERAGQMQKMTFHTVRENIQIALSNWGTFSDAETFVQSMNKNLCVRCVKDGETEVLLRPVRLIYAWDDWYLLYIMEDYRDNTDFHIEKLKRFSKIRAAGKAESLRVKDIVGTIIEYPAPTFGARHTRVERTEEYGDTLFVDIYGNADSFRLIYRRLPDGSLEFIKNDWTMLHGHMMETILNACDDDGIMDYLLQKMSDGKT